MHWAALGPKTFRTKMAMLFGLLSVAVGAPTFLYVGRAQHEHLVQEKRAHLQSLAVSAATVISENLSERRREIDLLAKTPLYRRAAFDHPEYETSLNRLQASYPYYSWIGLADTQGRVVAATSNHLLGHDISQRPWFDGAKSGAYMGDLHDAVLLARLLKTDDPTQPLRFIDIASPVLDDTGKLRGILCAHAYWRWAGEILATVTPADADAMALDLFIVNQHNQVIFPEGRTGKLNAPDLALLRGASGRNFLDWGQGKAYLTAFAPVKEPPSGHPLGWKILARMPEETVVANVRVLQHTLLLVGGTASLVLLLLVWIGADRMSRPLERLIDIAHRIQRGEERVHFDIKVGSLELQRLSEALRGMLATLVGQKDALATSNRELEAKVAERTMELQQLNRELYRLSRTDTLTGLPNRLDGNERLLRAYQQYRLGLGPYCLIMVDIDGFKQVNDAHGHAVGDHVLRHVAEQLRRSLRAADFIARVGGEEFMVILPGSSLEQALPVAEKLRAAVEAAPVAPVGRITISLGVQTVSNTDQDEDEAVRAADAWLYRAKQAGRNRVASAHGA